MIVGITGGTGFIGSRLAQHCASAGHSVRVLGQANTEAESGNIRALERQGIPTVLGSVTDAEVVARVVAGSDVVFHLAAAQHEMNVPDQRFWDVNVLGTRVVLEAAERADVRRVVHASTIGVHGALDGRIDEATPCQPDNIYGVTKLQGERLALEFRDRVPIVVVRMPEVYGPGDRRLLKLFRAIEKRRFFMIGSGRNLHQPMYVDDLVAGLLLAATSEPAVGHLFLFAGKEAVTTREMVSAIALALGRPGARLTLPLAPFSAAAAVMELVLRPVGIQPPLHRRRMDFFRKSFTLSGDRAEEVLGFVPATRFQDGARITAKWYRAHGLLAPERAEARSGQREETVPTTSFRSDTDARLTARMEPFDSFWEAPANIEKGYARFATFYSRNYLRYVPKRRDTRILVISCGPGYFVNLLRSRGYTDVLGIDSFPHKIAPAELRGLPCRAARAFGFLEQNEEPYDCIIAEQELNHLTKDEILLFFALAQRNLSAGGVLIAHAINGAHPVVGSESRWGNFDHYNAWTDYSLRQAMEYGGFEFVEVFDLNLYVFYANPLNYLAWVWDKMLRLFFQVAFRMVGKSNRLFSKKIGTVGRKGPSDRDT
jgi:dihydroflavonol-4-reductase